jgi:site-specific DNA-methyltransferase (adenine-specific)
MAWTSFKSSAKKFDKNPCNPNRIHPTEKPIALYKWLLHNYAKQGDKILDTHLGSGSIAIACHKMGFDLTGSELDKDYFEAMQKRIKYETAQLDLLTA